MRRPYTTVTFYTTDSPSELEYSVNYWAGSGRNQGKPVVAFRGTMKRPDVGMHTVALIRSLSEVLSGEELG